jgi:hypothetical protein
MASFQVRHRGSFLNFFVTGSLIYAPSVVFSPAALCYPRNAITQGIHPVFIISFPDEWNSAVQKTPGLMHYHINMTNEIYVFLMISLTIYGSEGKTLLKNGHNS